MTTILAIDPGPEQSAWVEWDTIQRSLGDYGIFNNGPIADSITDVYATDCDHLVLEHVTHYGSGMPVGASVFDTCIWIGRFIQAFAGPHTLLSRQTIKTHLCGTPRAKDSNVRQALIDRLGEPGTKKNPGKTYGIRTHLWSALAVAVTWSEMQEAKV